MCLISGISPIFTHIASVGILVSLISLVEGSNHNPWPFPLQYTPALHLTANSHISLPEAFLWPSGPILPTACQARTTRKLMPSQKQPSKTHTTRDIKCQAPPLSARVTWSYFFCLFTVFQTFPNGIKFQSPTVIAGLIMHLLALYPSLSHILTPLLAIPGIISKINYL